MILEVLVEGGADVPVVREVLARRFGLTEEVDFRIHPHRGKGRLPDDPSRRPAPEHRGLLDQLPAKLRGYARTHAYADMVIVVVIDADDEDCRELKRRIVELYNAVTPRPPRLLVRIAVEETESWFLADPPAVRAAYPKARTARLAAFTPDEVCGAWERLAEAIGRDPNKCTGADKYEWADAIAPHLDLAEPASPSLRALIEGVARTIELE